MTSRLWLYAAALAAFSGALALCIWLPGEFAFWVAPMPALVGLAIVGEQLLSPWDEIPARRRTAAWALSLTLAAAATPIVLLGQNDRAYLIGGLLVLPVVMLVVLRDDAKGTDTAVGGDPAAGLPDFLP